MKPSRPYLIGLTGGIATGKSHLSQALREAGADVIDADAIARALTAPGGAALAPIRAAFGQTVFDGPALNRRRLAAIVFAHPDRLAQLNAIVHPMVFAEIRRQIGCVRAPAAVLDVPLLHETGWAARCDTVWCAYAPQRVQIERLRERDGLSIREARLRLKSQMTGLEKARRSDHVIRTDVPPACSARQVLALWADVRRRLSDEHP